MSKSSLLTRDPSTESMINPVSLTLTLSNKEEHIINLPTGADATVVREVLLQQELFEPAGIKTGNFQSHDELRYLSVGMTHNNKPITEIKVNDQGQILATTSDGEVNISEFVILIAETVIPQIAFDIAAKLERQTLDKRMRRAEFSDQELEYLKKLEDPRIAIVFLQSETPEQTYPILAELEALKGNREVVLAAVRQDGEVLGFASKELRIDQEMVLAVEQNTRVTSELRQNREVVLAAVEGNGMMLEYVPNELQEDPEIALAAIRQNGFAIKYVPDKLLTEYPQFILEAVRQNGDVLHYGGFEEGFFKFLQEKILTKARKNPTKEDIQKIAGDMLEELEKEDSTKAFFFSQPPAITTPRHDPQDQRMEKPQQLDSSDNRGRQ